MEDEPYFIKKFVHTYEDRPNVIDNGSLVGEFSNELKKKLLVNHDFVLIPESAWKYLHSIYGGGPEFKRFAYKDKSKNQQIVELYPPILNCYKTDSNGEIIH